jgi:hypothetical protein
VEQVTGNKRTARGVRFAPQVRVSPYAPAAYGVLRYPLYGFLIDRDSGLPCPRNASGGNGPLRIAGNNSPVGERHSHAGALPLWNRITLLL